MNDPHVSVLIYRVRHDETVNYDKASPLEYETASFKVSIKGCEAHFEMKEHFRTAEQAREVVGPFIRQWEFAAALDRDPGEFELVFLEAVVEDRKPTPGVVDVARQETVQARDFGFCRSRPWQLPGAAHQRRDRCRCRSDGPSLFAIPGGKGDARRHGLLLSDRSRTSRLPTTCAPEQVRH